MSCALPPWRRAEHIMGMPAARDTWTVDMRPAYPYALSELLLAIEVESPGNPLYDYHTKRQLYLGNGVPEYWVVYADARIVSRWRHVDEPGEVFGEVIEWWPSGMAAPLRSDLPALFDEALG